MHIDRRKRLVPWACTIRRQTMKEENEGMHRRGGEGGSSGRYVTPYLS